MTWWIILLLGIVGGGLIGVLITWAFYHRGKNDSAASEQRIKEHMEKIVRPILIAQGLTEHEATTTSALITRGIVKMVGTTTTKKITFANITEGETPEVGSNIQTDPSQSQPESEEEPPEDQ